MNVAAGSVLKVLNKFTSRCQLFVTHAWIASTPSETELCTMLNAGVEPTRSTLQKGQTFAESSIYLQTILHVSKTQFAQVSALPSSHFSPLFYSSQSIVSIATMSTFRDYLKDPAPEELDDRDPRTDSQDFGNVVSFEHLNLEVRVCNFNRSSATAITHMITSRVVPSWAPDMSQSPAQHTTASQCRTPESLAVLRVTPSSSCNAVCLGRYLI